MAVIPLHIKVALSELGHKEWDDGSNPEIEKYIAATPRGRWAFTDAVSWCGGFCAFTALKAGLEVPENAHRARAWLAAGEKVDEPEFGDVCVVQLDRAHRRRRGRTGSARGGYHVGWFMGKSRGGVILLSGNAGDRVGFDWYSPTVWHVRGYRRL